MGQQGDSYGPLLVDLLTAKPVVRVCERVQTHAVNHNRRDGARRRDVVAS